ncbi:amidohydrolase family protein [Ohtaekwangia sp.]|uniref:amidohydrolase family protein n=1 Tax=Ohtaekwangia sp. TaxID=2066019 RepID=UPI002F93840E
MKRILYFILILVCAGMFSVQAQSPKAIDGTFALTNATIETVTKGVIQNGTVIISKGKIAAVGTNIPIPAGAEVIDCKGQWIYPGMIDSNTQLGLSEVASDQRTRDFEEVGDIIPQVRAITAVNPNSALIPVTRISGVTTVIASPRGSLISGTAALIDLHGYTPDQMFAGFEGVVMTFPDAGRRGFFDRRTDEELKKDYDKKLNKLNEAWDKAVQYHKIDSASKSKGITYYPEMQALLPVVRGERALLIQANAAKDILNALKWVKDKKIKKVILTGVAEGWRVADEIAKANIPVLAGPVLDLPSRDYDRYDKAYANPGLMKKAGVKVALCTQEDRGNVRNLPYHAAFAAAYGMGREEALKSVTIVPAEIFGVADRMGSIEVGKNATLFICDGDPFETKTNIKQVFIDGWKIPMVSRQTELYDEFLKREPGLSKN